MPAAPREALRRHGQPPYGVAVLHGGPGAAGEAAPVARELAARGYGVLEPFQSAQSVVGQVRELKDILEQYGTPPLALVGCSWGAWLACLLAAEFPALVSRLVLVGSGPFTAEDAAQILPRRLARLSDADALLLKKSLETKDLGDPATRDRVMELLARCDSYNPLPQGDAVDFDPRIYEGVWPQAAELRRSGELLRRVRTLQCPVVAIHGVDDPHPAAGVEVPLKAALRDVRFVPLERCGHQPWAEREARSAFYRELERALAG